QGCCPPVVRRKYLPKTVSSRSFLGNLGTNAYCTAKGLRSHERGAQTRMHCAIVPIEREPTMLRNRHAKNILLHHSVFQVRLSQLRTVLRLGLPSRSLQGYNRGPRKGR